MEKVRFEAFNVEELRVLRRACYEAGAAFGDPGHTAAERATLDDLAVEILGELKKKGAAAAQQKQEEPVEKAAEDSEKGTAERLPFAPKAFQKPEPQKKRAVQRLDILERAQKLHSPPKAPTGPRSRPSRQSLPTSCMCAAKNAARNAASAQRHRFPRVIAGSAAGKRSSKICARSRSGASAAALTGTTRISRTPHLICRA